MSILIKPIITEKATNDSELFNRYSFVVDKSANKIEIKKAETPRKKNEDLRINISQGLDVSNDLTMKPPQLKQKPPNKRSIYPGIL